MILTATEEPQVVIKATVDGQVAGTAGADVALPDHVGTVAAPQLLREQLHAQIDTAPVTADAARAWHLIILIDVAGEAPREKAGARGRAVLERVKIVQPHPFCCG
tara:strand:+ start:643 stop:957 length:315 start_codon:yes stop_codon:yes gene_type:complete